MLLLSASGSVSNMVLPIITGLIAPKAVRSGSAGRADATIGNYNQSCIVGTFGASCNGDLRCYPTSSGQERCCEYSSAAGVRSYSGESKPETSVSPILMTRTSAALGSDNTSCQYNLTCCDGRSATGNCTYAEDTINEYGEADYAGFKRTGQYPYIRTCNCTCP